MFSLILCSRSACMCLCKHAELAMLPEVGKEGKGEEDTYSNWCTYRSLNINQCTELSWLSGTAPFIIICSVLLCNYSCVLGVASYPGSSPCTGRSLGTSSRLYWEHAHPLRFAAMRPNTSFYGFSLHVSSVDSN